MPKIVTATLANRELATNWITGKGCRHHAGYRVTLRAFWEVRHRCAPGVSDNLGNGKKSPGLVGVDYLASAADSASTSRKVENPEAAATIIALIASRPYRSS